MFKQLFSWWKEDIILKQALEQSGVALEKAGNMFLYAMDVFLEVTGEEKEIYEMDKEINTLQVDTRRKILQHLSINPEQDVTASLVLITTIVDIERIGDYAKNIVELHPMCGPPLKLEDLRYFREINDIKQQLKKLIPETTKAFLDADAVTAKRTTDEYTVICRKCDNIIGAITCDNSLMVKEAVVCALLFRYLKRVSSHGRNISTSVVNPFDRLGYKPE